MDDLGISAEGSGLLCRKDSVSILHACGACLSGLLDCVWSLEDTGGEGIRCLNLSASR